MGSRLRGAAPLPWSVPDVTPNRSVTKALGAQAFRYCKTLFANPLLNFAARIDAKAGKDEWQRAALMQTARQVWSHDNGSLWASSTCTLLGEPRKKVVERY
uniref:RxLR effector candidate protein n=1 Tax=Hyaloperonospora arabidopsidis (strain Emoy2) TaxID=559515 RepID=M4BSW7_HYAAE